MSKQMTADSEIVAADGLRSPPQFGMSNSRANSMRMECGCSLRLQYRVPHFNGGGRVRKSLQRAYMRFVFSRYDFIRMKCQLKTIRRQFGNPLQP